MRKVALEKEPLLLFWISPLMRAAIALDRNSNLPLHRQVYEEWRTGILNGRFRRGQRMPSTRDLAALLGLARTTIAAAYDQLTAEGYCETARGSGTFVCRRLPEELLRVRPAPPEHPSSEAPFRISRYGERISEQTPYAAPQSKPGWISFSRWRPDLNEFPFPLWRRLLSRHIRVGGRAIFDYTSGGAGHEALRREIAAYAARSRAVDCDPSQVIVVNGSQQALDLCARLLLDP